MRLKISAFLLFLFLFSAWAFADAEKKNFYQGLEFYHSGDYEEAAAAFREQLKTTPNDESSMRWMKLAIKRLSQAEVAAEKIAPGTPQLPENTPPGISEPAEKKCSP